MNTTTTCGIDRQHCTGCGNTSLEDVSNSYSGCCNEPVAYWPCTGTDHEVPGTICIDCGTPTYCGVAHGAGHDHSVASQACTLVGDRDSAKTL